MDKIPTAEEYANSIYQEYPVSKEICELMIGFAKLHAEAQNKAILEKVKLLITNNEEYKEPNKEDLLDFYECGTDNIQISSSSILNAYPLNLIK